MHSLVYCLRAPFRPHSKSPTNDCEEGAHLTTPTDQKQFHIYQDCRPPVDTLLILTQSTLPDDHPSTLHLPWTRHHSSLREYNDSGTRIDDILASPGIIGRVRMLRIVPNAVTKRIKQWKDDRGDDHIVGENDGDVSEAKETTMFVSVGKANSGAVSQPHNASSIMNNVDTYRSGRFSEFTGDVDKSEFSLSKLSLQLSRETLRNFQNDEEPLVIGREAPPEIPPEEVPNTHDSSGQSIHSQHSDITIDFNGCNETRLSELRIPYQLRPESELSDSEDAASGSIRNALHQRAESYGRNLAFANLFGIMTDGPANDGSISETSETRLSGGSWRDQPVSPTSSIYSRSITQDVPEPAGLSSADGTEGTLTVAQSTITPHLDHIDPDANDANENDLITQDTKPVQAHYLEGGDHNASSVSRVIDRSTETATPICYRITNALKAGTDITPSPTQKLPQPSTSMPKTRKSSLFRHLLATTATTAKRCVSSPALVAQFVSNLDGEVDQEVTPVSSSGRKSKLGIKMRTTRISKSFSHMPINLEADCDQRKQQDRSLSVGEPRVRVGSISSFRRHDEQEQQSPQQRPDLLSPSTVRRRASSVRCDASTLMEDAIAAYEEERAAFRIAPPQPSRETGTLQGNPSELEGREESSPAIVGVTPRRIGTRLQSWCQFPSYNRRERTTSAGQADGVLTRDFGGACEEDGQSSGQDRNEARLKNGSRHKRGPIQTRPNTFGDLLRYYGNVFTTGRVGNRRTSVTRGGWLEHPELEMIPPASASEPPAGNPHHHKIISELLELEERAHEGLIHLEQQAADVVHHHHHQHHHNHQEYSKLFHSHNPFLSAEETPKDRARRPSLLIDPHENASKQGSSGTSTARTGNGLADSVGEQSVSSRSSSDMQMNLDGGLDICKVRCSKAGAGSLAMRRTATKSRLPADFKGSVRRFPSVTVVDDMQGLDRSVSLISQDRRRSGIVRASTHDLLELLDKKAKEERARLLEFVDSN